MGEGDPVNVIVKFQIRPEKVEEFKDFMQAYLPGTLSYPGCKYSHLMQDQNDSARFWFVERWQSRAAEREYVAWRMSTPDSEALLGMLAAPPQTVYCDTVWAPPA